MLHERQALPVTWRGGHKEQQHRGPHRGRPFDGRCPGSRPPLVHTSEKKPFASGGRLSQLQASDICSSPRDAGRGEEGPRGGQVLSLVMGHMQGPPGSRPVVPHSGCPVRPGHLLRTGPPLPVCQENRRQHTRASRALSADSVSHRLKAAPGSSRSHGSVNAQRAALAGPDTPTVCPWPGRGTDGRVCS